MLVVLGGRREHLLGDLVDELRPPVAQDLRRAGGRVDARRIALADAPRERDLLRIDVRDGDRADEAVAVGHAHGAPVGELRNRELGDLLQRALVVQRRGQQLARRARAALRELGALDLGDVLDDVDDELELAVGAVDAGGLRHAPVDRAGALLTARTVSGLGSRSPASSCRPGRSSSRSGEPSSFVESKASTICSTGVAEQLLRGAEAEHPRGRLVGVDQGAAGVLHGHRLGERRQRRGQLRLDRLELGEQAGVVERERGAAGEHLGELEVLVGVAAAASGP